MRLLRRGKKDDYQMVGSPEYQLIMKLEDLFREFQPKGYLYCFDLEGTLIVGGQAKAISRLLKGIGEHVQSEGAEELVIGIEQAKEE